MPSKGGPAARNAINPEALLAYVDRYSEYVVGGYPKRRRLCINDIPITENDARMIRRWRVGKIHGVTVTCAQALLGRYDLTLRHFAIYCNVAHYEPMIRGKLPKESHE